MNRGTCAGSITAAPAPPAATAADVRFRELQAVSLNDTLLFLVSTITSLLIDLIKCTYNKDEIRGLNNSELI